MSLAIIPCLLKFSPPALSYLFSQDQSGMMLKYPTHHSGVLCISKQHLNLSAYNVQGAGAAICQGDSLTLVSTTAFAYKWNTGVTTATIAGIKAKAKYTVQTYSKDGCISPMSDTVSITVYTRPVKPSITSSKANAYLMERGIIPREVVAYGLPQCLRITIGTEEENSILINTLTEFMKSA